jgi:exopolysaccharide biosynthesis polyprenyl glycosylphosphotransferase
MAHALHRQEAIFIPSVPVASPGRRSMSQLLFAAAIGDALVVFFALAASAWLRFATPLADLGVDAHSITWNRYFSHAVFGTLLFSFICVHLQVYAPSLTLRPRTLSATLFKATCVWLVAYIALAYLLRFDQPVSRIYVGIAFFVTTASLFCWRQIFQKVTLRAAAEGRFRRRVLFVDWSPNAAALVDALIADREHLYEITGCVSPSGTDYSLAPPARLRRLGGYDRLPELLRRGAADMVILAGLNPPDGEMVRLANLCEKEMIEFKVIPSCFQTLVSGLHLETLRGVPLLGVSHLPLDNPINAILKRLVDIVGAIAGLILSAPLIAVFGYLVHRESPGPIFYRQRRLGRDGQPFWCYKIRSMRLDAESDGKVGWSTREDPRRLRIGALMRRWNIDETPQFWNVLKGEMSLVGPRPERPELILNFKEAIPHYNARHNIKPGLTGWAQINGFRGDTDLNERIRCDLFYIENWNVLLDFQIMFLTLFQHKNAC